MHCFRSLSFGGSRLESTVRHSLTLTLFSGSSTLFFQFFSFFRYPLPLFLEIRQRRGVATEMRPSGRMDSGGTARSRSHWCRYQHCCGHSGFSVIIICNFSLESPPYSYSPSSHPRCPPIDPSPGELLCARERHWSILLN